MWSQMMNWVATAALGPWWPAIYHPCLMASELYTWACRTQLTNETGLMKLGFVSFRQVRRGSWWRKASSTNTGNQMTARRRTGKTSTSTTGTSHLRRYRQVWVRCRQLSLTELMCSLRESVCYRNFQVWASSLCCLLSCSSPDDIDVIRLTWWCHSASGDMTHCRFSLNLFKFKISFTENFFVLTVFPRWKRNHRTHQQR